MTTLPESQLAHSPLGASGAERWIKCPGSVALLKSLMLPESDEPDYRKNGIAAHEAAAVGLTTGQDAWELVGQKFHDTEVDVEIADAIQQYFDYARPIMARAVEDGTFIEYRISSPVHKDFYGTVDLAVIERGTEHFEQEILNIVDYKHGEGIMVEVEENPQLMYYAFGKLQDHPDIERVRLTIAQPRGFHVDGPIRIWETTATHIKEWAENVLIPAMLRTELDHDLDAGPWCRFCPAKLVCPLMNSLFGAAMKADPTHVVNLDLAALGRSYQYTQAVKFYLKAVEEEAFRRANLGQKIPGAKLVQKKANRVWKSGAPAIIKTHFPDKAMTAPEIKSPAEIDKLGSAAKAITREWAYTPQSGLTLAYEDDNRPEIIVQTTDQMFSEGITNLATGSAEDFPDLPDFLNRKTGDDNG